jgi:hypothetical protein
MSGIHGKKNPNPGCKPNCLKRIAQKVIGFQGLLCKASGSVGKGIVKSRGGVAPFFHNGSLPRRKAL